MKPIACVHWTDKNDQENSKDFYDMLTLSKYVNMLNRQNLVSYTTLTSLHADIPVTAHRIHVRAV